ncbi:hypothetical protein KKJ04_25430, partial [Xenorhabdus bovienii]
LNSQRQQKAESALEHTEMLAEQSGGQLPQFLQDKLQQNRQLSQMLNQQTQSMDAISSQQRKAASDILTVRQTLNTIREQAQWL